MTKITKTIEIDKYEAFAVYTELTFDEIFYNENIEVVFNTNNTGGFNFLDYTEHSFETIEEIKEMANGRKFSVLSLYQENGYVGVYQNSDDNALKVKCNNWVDNGRNGFLYVVFYNDNDDLNDLIKHIYSYINGGVYEVQIMDNELDEVVDNIIVATWDDLKHLKTVLEQYELTEEDIKVW